MTTVETKAFTAEVQEVLNLVIHSLYSNKEIFLRELASNASDALDKLRFAALTDSSLLSGDGELHLQIEFDKEAKTLVIRDNGIGMSHDEVVENLGTIARSGTRRFMQALKTDDRKDVNLIGQFGVGFYSAFIVAEEVTVHTLKAGLGSEHGVRWRSNGDGGYSIERLAKETRGTEITLKLKAEEEEFRNDWRLRGLLSKYSEHLAFPIKLKNEKGEWESLSQGKAIWTRAKNELGEADYHSFYQGMAHDAEAPLAYAHNKVEGSQSYTTLLYVPQKLPFDLRYGGRDERRGLKLYVRRVFIMDAAENLLPAYLRFVRGVVDSDDLPLNVSRELLQDSKLTAAIRASCVKRALDLLEKIAGEDPEKYMSFLKECGSVLKEGLAEDFANRDKIAKLLRFASTTTSDAEPRVSFLDYIARMRPGQEAIYYLTADSYLTAKNSPHLEALRGKGVEVLLLHDRVDEWVISHLSEVEGKRLANIAKGDLDLSKIDHVDGSKAPEGRALENDLAARIKTVLGERVSEVRASLRLTESAACLVVNQYAMALHLQRLMKQAGQDLPNQSPILELNPEHPLLKRLSEAGGSDFDDLAWVLYDQAVLAEGAPLEDASAFVRRINSLIMSKAS